MSEFQGFFLLQTPRDLFAKLQRDFDRIQADPGSNDAAFDFFLTAEHLLDWCYPGRANCDKRRQLRESTPLLSVVSHIANGAKHFRADAPHHNSVTGETAVERGISFPISLPLAFPLADLVVDLDGSAAAEFGAQARVRDLAAALLEYWEPRLT